VRTALGDGILEAARRSSAAPDETRRTRPGKTTRPGEPMHSAIQVGASLLILVPFVLTQLGRLTPTALPYLVLNLAGSTVLAVDAALGHQWGFLLEAVWAVVSAISLLRLLRRPAGPGPVAG